ncbi:MAG: FHA domain-containing protein [Bifidobacteriaceae bacterium]|nr:FHA domain-containing protein [Bifidobacteriaceae bacterium]
MLSNGEQFPLDRSLVVGRKPRSPRFAPGDEPRLVALGDDYQDISRSHVLIALDDWSVTVHDLGSTNGTWLKRVGQPDRRLGESDPVLAESGDVYDIGDGLTITLAGLP